MTVYAVRVGRATLAVVFIYAAGTKLRQPWEVLALSIDFYGVLPEWAVILVGTLGRDGARTLLSALVTAGAVVLSRRACGAPVGGADAGVGHHVPGEEAGRP